MKVSILFIYVFTLGVGLAEIRSHYSQQFPFSFPQAPGTFGGPVCSRGLAPRLQPVDPPVLEAEANLMGVRGGPESQTLQQFVKPARCCDGSLLP